jgi:hypothetical protein
VAIDRVKLVNLKKLISITTQKLLSVEIDDEDMYDDLEGVIINLISKKSILAVPGGLITPLPKVLSKNVTIDSLVENDILQNFRFRNKAQLKDLLKGLDFDDFYRDFQNHVFTGEEILLSGLFRLHAKNNLGDESWKGLFG